MNKLFIKNRHGQKLSVLVEGEENKGGLAFVMHGLGGFKEQKHIETFAKAFLDNGYTVVRFDTTNTLGESDGDYGDSNFTKSYNDLEDIIKWAGTQDWYQEPFGLAGHSLGSGCSLFYAANNPEKIKGLAPTSTVLGGKYTLARYRKEDLRQWEETGVRSGMSASKPGVMKELKWEQFKEDILQYDIVPMADKLTMPVLMIVGSEDMGTPFEDQKLLLDKLPGEKEIHSIEGAPHTFKEPEHLEEIYKIFDNWIKKIN